MDCNKANTLIMDYMDNDISDEDMFLLMNHIENCKECKKSFEIYNQVLEEFSIVSDIDLDIDISDDFEEEIMKKIETIEPRYISKKRNREKVAYVFLGLSSLIFSLGLLINLNKDIFLESLSQMPIFSKYYTFFEQILNISFNKLSFDYILEKFSIILPYVLEGIKYTSIVTVVVLIVAQYVLYRRKTLKI